MYSVYLHTFPNGKKYVGITNCKPELRWGANGCNYKNPYMKNAIKKYGWNNIKHEILAENLTIEDAEQMEISLIAQYRSAEKSYGYNISLGGIINKRCSDETREKLRRANLGKVMSLEAREKISNFQRNQTRTKEVRMHMSAAQKLNFKNGNDALHSPEARAKAALKLKGRKPSEHAIQKANEAKNHPVKNLQTGIVYPSIKAACESTGLDRTTIIRHCKGTLKSKKWQYAELY